MRMCMVSAGAALLASPADCVGDDCEVWNVVDTDLSFSSFSSLCKLQGGVRPLAAGV